VTTITLPSNKTESSTGPAWERHILSDAEGPQIRDAITAFEGTDSRELFRAHGTRY